MSEIQFDRLAPVWLFSIPRGGSNFFSAFLHNHDSMVVLTHKAAKRYVDGLKTGDSAGLSAADYVYAESPPHKDPDVVSHLVLHNMHYHKQKKLFYVESGLEQVQAGRAQGIVLFRHPVSVLLSMDAFGKKFDRPGWRLTRDNCYAVMTRFILPQLRMLANSRIFPVEIGSFVKDINTQYAALSGYLGLDYKHRYGSFAETFGELCASDGAPYKIKEFTSYSGGFLEAKGYTPEPQPMFYNASTGQPLLGRGGFNPCASISHSRLTAFKSRLTPEAKRVLESVFKAFMPARSAAWLLENEDLSIERLRALDIRRNPLRTMLFVSASLAGRARRRLGR